MSPNLHQNIGGGLYILMRRRIVEIVGKDYHRYGRGIFDVMFGYCNHFRVRTGVSLWCKINQ